MRTKINEPEEYKQARRPPKGSYLYRRQKYLISTKTTIPMAKRKNSIISHQ